MKILAILSLALLIPFSTISAQTAQVEKQKVVHTILIESNCSNLKEAVVLSKLLEAQGAHISVIVGPQALLGWVEGTVPVSFANTPQVLNVFSEWQQLPAQKQTDPNTRMAFRYFEKSLNGELEVEKNQSSTPMSWDHLAHPDALDRAAEEAQKSGGNGIPDWTCNNGNNSETMLGVILANTFFLESDGTIDTDDFTWSQTAIDDVKLQIIDAWSIWAYSASLYGQSITAVMNWYDNTDTIANTSYEPIYHPSSDDYLWINEAMSDLGYTSGSKFTNLDNFHHDIRQTNGADHSFSCFMIYNPPAQGAPTSMTNGAIGYAYLGGPYTQMMYKANGWSTSQLYRVYAHEIGHIFHAFDEYSSSGSANCTRSFNGVVSANYQGSPCNGSQSCVMINNSHTGSGATRRWNLCDHTPDHLGWEFLLPEPILVEPLFNEVLSSVPIRLEWDRDTVIPGTYGYVKIWNRSNDSLVLCQYSNTDTLMVNLVNGDYKWRVSNGNLSASSGYAGVLSDTSYFTVNAPLQANFSFNPSTVCVGQSVFFNDQSTGAPNYWQWQFPGGSPSMHIGLDPPAVTYTTSGSFDATLIVNDGGGGADTLEIVNAITVTGGQLLPEQEAFELAFPPTNWSTCCGGTQGGPPDGGAWDTLTTGTSGFGTSAFFDNFNDPQGYAWGYLATPQLDLSLGDSALLIFDVAYAFAGADSADALQVNLYNCDYSVYATPYSKSGDSLSTNGGALVSDSMWYPTDPSHWRRDTVDLTAFIGNVLTFEFTNQGQGGQAIFLDNVNIRTRNDWQLDLRVFLEGPYDDLSGLMKDDLRAAGIIPLTEPYSALGYGFLGGGGETIDPTVLNVTGPAAIVDWVIVELHDQEDPSIVIASRAALLRRDGSVINVDGTTLVTIPGIWSGFYYVAIRHRDHLGVMFGFPNASSYTPIIDYANGLPPMWGGSSATNYVNGTRVLWAGDVNFDGVIKYTGSNNDRDLILSNIGGTIPTATNSGYFGEDVNMDGVVKYTGSDNDRDIILQNIGGAVPTATRSEQIP